MFGGRPLSGVGFGLGILTLKLFLETCGLLPGDPGASSRPQVFVAVYSPGEYSTALRWAEALRDAGIRTELDPWSRTLNRQFASAVKKRIPFVMTVGPEEAASGRPRLKEMGTGVESDVTVGEAVAIIEGRKEV
jgi:histidyl-tRNA synthetase